MSNKYNKHSDRSGWIDTADERPEWQQERGKRYGNRRKEVSRMKWEDRKRDRRKNKFNDYNEYD